MRAVRLGAFLVAAALTPELGAAPAVAPRMPHPGPEVPRADAAGDNDGCVRCHASIGDEWRESMHAAAHTDPVYQRALAPLWSVIPVTV